MTRAIVRKLATVLGIVLLPFSITPAFGQSCGSAAPQAPSTTATSGTFRIYAYGVANATSMAFPTWGPSGGQDDIIWYPGYSQGGTWYADIDLANHKSGNPEYGTFNTHVYANGPSGQVLCAATTWTREVQQSPSCSSAAPSSPSTTATSGLFRIYAYGVANATSMLFPAWGPSGGQDDISWYPGYSQGGGTWYADVDLANHKSGNPEYGSFNTHVYAYGPGGSALCAATTWTRDVQQPASCSSAAPASPSTTATSGLLRIYAYGVANATSVTFPTWGRSGDQDDIVNYPGYNQGGGTWYADVNLANHKPGNPETGTFDTHVYAYGPGGSALCAATTWSRTLPQPSCTSVIPNDTVVTGTSGTLRVTAYGVTNAVTVTFPTWGFDGGPDDLFWYQGINAGNGTWYADINLANHKAGNPEFGYFFTQAHAHRSVGSAEQPCSQATWYRIASPPPSQSLTSSTGVTVALDAIRGGAVGSITVAGVGETVVNDRDGRGMGTGGFLFNESEGTHYLWYEGGCDGDGHNTNVSFQSTATSLTGTATKMKLWGGGSPAGCDPPSNPAYNRFLDFQISHTVSFPNAPHKAVVVQQTVTNLTGGIVTPTSTNYARVGNEDIPMPWPLAPQIALDRAKFVDSATNHGHWRIRNSDGSWSDQQVVQTLPGAWLNPYTDFYAPSGHAIAVYKDSAHTSGVALFCKFLDFGFFANDLIGDGIVGIANVWSFGGSSLAPNASASKTCHVVYGSETEISSAINSF